VTDEEFQRVDHTWARPLATILACLVKEVRHLGITILCGAIMISCAICNSGCVTSPMAEFRQDVVTECEAAREYLSRGCAIPIDEPPCGAEVAETDRCMGLQEAVYQCWQGVSVYCAPWGPDVGSQCDEPEWALRTCLWPELLEGGA
jgi:hypothetical protein